MGSTQEPLGSNIPISKTQKTPVVASKMTVCPKKKEVKLGSTRAFSGSAVGSPVSGGSPNIAPEEEEAPIPVVTPDAGAPGVAPWSCD